MVQATQWQRDSVLLPNNPYQRIRYYPAWPGGMRAFGWHPVPLTIKPVGSPTGFMPTGGISGVGADLLSLAGVARIVGGVAGVLVGVALAKRNLGR